MKTLEKCDVLTQKDHELLHRVVQAIRKHTPDAKIILYGSRARGDAHPESDYDMVVITPQKVNSKTKENIYGETDDILLDTDQLISVFIYSKERWDSPICKGSPFYADVLEDGVVL